MTNSENSPLAEPKAPVGSDTTSQPEAEKKTESQTPKPDPIWDWEKAAVASTSKLFQRINLDKE